MINVRFEVKVWKDKKTKSWLMYSKEFEISAYGKTKNKAREMFVLQVREFLKKTK